MGFFRKAKQKTMDELEEENERVTVMSDTRSKEADIAEREVVITQLKRENGPGWARMLGVSKLTDISTLRSFLKGAKDGMAKQASMGGSPLSKVTSFKGIVKA